MDDRVTTVLAALDERSRGEQAELAALNARGARFVREAAPRLMLDVGPDVGRLLNLLVVMSGARRIVEVGGSVGYSTIWLAEAARATGGRVISIETDPGKQAEQRANLETAGLAGHVDLVLGDASVALPGLREPLDLVLIDHWKALYVREFDLVWPKMRRGGVVVADNILRPEATIEEMRAYVAHVRAAPGARSFTLDIGSGIELACKEPVAS